MILQPEKTCLLVFCVRPPVHCVRFGLLCLSHTPKLDLQPLLCALLLQFRLLLQKKSRAPWRQHLSLLFSWLRWLDQPLLLCRLSPRNKLSRAQRQEGKSEPYYLKIIRKASSLWNVSDDTVTTYRAPPFATPLPPHASRGERPSRDSRTTTTHTYNTHCCSFFTKFVP